MFASNNKLRSGIVKLTKRIIIMLTSGDPVTYTNWVPGRYSTQAHGFEDCTEFIPYKNHGQWDNVQCGGNAGTFSEFLLKKNYYICQFRKYINIYIY